MSEPSIVPLCRTIELSDYRTVGPSNCRAKELSDHNYETLSLVLYLEEEDDTLL
jgi:hypothetical protein